MKSTLAILLSTVVLAGAAMGCSKSTSSGGAQCVGGDRELGAVDQGSTLVIAGGNVYIGGPSAASFERVSLQGGTSEVIDSAGHVDFFAANDAGTIAWVDAAANVIMRDPKGVQVTLPKPANVTTTSAIAVDGAGNVFVLSNGQLPYPEVIWRYSPSRNVSDVIFSALGGVGATFYRDGNGIAWIGPADANLVVYHEDAEGGAPTAGAIIEPGTNVIGLDAQSVYYTNGYGGGAGQLKVSAIDRKTSAVSVALETEGTFYTPSFAIDDEYVYWLIQRSDGATLSRAPKGGGSPEVVVTESKMSGFTVGGCNVAYVRDDISSFNVVTHAK